MASKGTRSKSVIQATKYVAGKQWSMGSRVFKTGDPVDVAKLGIPDHKIGQLLNQRHLVLVSPE